MERAAERLVQTRALRISLAVNAAYMLVEFVGGVVFNSLALIADTVHMLSDVAGLAIALLAVQLASRRVTARHSFGLERAEVLGHSSTGSCCLPQSVGLSGRPSGA